MSSTDGPPAPPPPAGPRVWWSGLPGTTRRRLKLLLGGAVLVLVVVGVLLARFLSVENTERDADLAVVQAQARGDLGAMLADLPGCSTRPHCLRAVRENVHNPRLLRHGAVKILDLQSPTAYSFGGASGKTRLAWTVLGDLPIVQCIEVHRSGNFLTGIDVTLVSISAPISNEGDC